MTDLRKAAQQALEALEGFNHFRRIMTDGPDESDKVFAEDHAEVAFVTAARVIPALKQALAEPEQEPIALNNGRLTQYPDGSIGVGTPAEPEQKVWCDCGDSIEPDSGARCGNCVAGDSAEPEQQPDGISWLKRDSGYFTAPTPRKPVELTDDEIQPLKWYLEVEREYALTGQETLVVNGYLTFAREVIAAYEAKNGITGEQHE